MAYRVEDLKPPGRFAIREAAMSGSQRDQLKQSLKDRPEKTRAGAVIFTNITPSELVDPHHPPQHAEGPLTIAANNRFFFHSELTVL